VTDVGQRQEHAMRGTDRKRTTRRTDRRRGGTVLATAAVAVLALTVTGCTVTPADSFWHADVRGLPVHASSSTWVNTIGASGRLKADFGSGLWDGGPIGIPYTVIPGSQPLVDVDLGYDDSD